MTVGQNRSDVSSSGSAAGRTLQRLFGGLHASIYRLTGGTLGGRFANSPVLLLTTTGRKTGKQRVTPLLYLMDGSNVILVASNGGAPKDPTWWLNLKGHPDAQVQIGRQVMKVKARQASAEERSRLWSQLVKMYPSYADYQKKTTREIPVVILSPV